MSYNGTGTFSINTSGQPVVTGTTITSTAFNTLTADLATGLSTALCKDGQSTPTANIGMGAFKITNLGAGTLATDAARLSQIQSGAATFIVASGTDTILGTASPALTAYATGNAFQFTVAATNTAAVTLNIDSLGAKAVTRDGSTALVAGDLVSGSVVTVVYDGTRFQVLNSNSKTNFNLSGTLTAASTATASKFIPTGTSATGNGMYLPAANSVGFSTNGAEAMRIASAGNVIIGGATAIGGAGLTVTGNGAYLSLSTTPSAGYQLLRGYDGSTERWAIGQNAFGGADGMAFYTGSSTTERMRIDASGSLGVGTASPSSFGKFAIQQSSTTLSGARIDNTASSITGRGVYSTYTSSLNNNTTAIHFAAYDGTVGSDVFRVYGNGNVVNTNNSYGAISDAKLKENIVDASPKLVDLMQIKVRNYNIIGSTTKQIGVVAQELETIFPSMIDESPDSDLDGNDSGTTTKSVKYSVFVPILIKAIQEQQAIIESLTVRIATLESK